MMLLVMHRPHLHQPWRLGRCNPISHSFVDPRQALLVLAWVPCAALALLNTGWPAVLLPDARPPTAGENGRLNPKS